MKTKMLVFLMLIAVNSFAQDREKIVEKRTRDLYEALKSSDKAVWKKYVEENYSPALIEKRGMEKILGMWQNLHNDFGTSKLVSVEMKDNLSEMMLKQTDGPLMARFTLTPEAKAPYRWELLSIQAGDKLEDTFPKKGNGEVIIKN